MAALNVMRNLGRAVARVNVEMGRRDWSGAEVSEIRCRVQAVLPEGAPEFVPSAEEVSAARSAYEAEVLRLEDGGL